MNNVNKVIVSPCSAGFAITKFGNGALTIQPIQPTFYKDWKRADMRKSLKILYPKATIVFVSTEMEIIESQAFGNTWIDLKPKK